MTNPFRATGDNPYDRPLIGGKLDNGGTAPQSDHAVLFDAATRTVSPAGQAMMQMMMAQLRAEAQKMAEATISKMAKEMAKRDRQIAELERALDIKRSETAAAIQAEIDTFLGDDQPLDERKLERMAEAHAAKMQGVGK